MIRLREVPDIRDVLPKLTFCVLQIRGKWNAICI